MSPFKTCKAFKSTKLKYLPPYSFLEFLKLKLSIICLTFCPCLVLIAFSLVLVRISLCFLSVSKPQTKIIYAAMNDIDTCTNTSIQILGTKKLLSKEMRCCCFGKSLSWETFFGDAAVVSVYSRTFDRSSMLYWKSGKSFQSVSKSRSIRKFQLLGIPDHLDDGHCYPKSSQKSCLYKRIWQILTNVSVVTV